MTETAYRIHTRVARVEEKFVTHSVHKDPNNPNDTVAHRESLGFFLLMQGSSEYVHIGKEEPALKPGDHVEIIIRKRP